MPSQRTLIVMIAGLLVTLSYLVGYISGSKPVPQGSVQTLGDDGRVKASHTARTRQGDPVPQETGTSYNSVYTDDRGEVYHPAQARKGGSPQLSGPQSGEAARKPKFVFMPKAEKKTPYSWRNKKRASSGIVYRDPAHGSVRPIEQGDGLYRRSGSRTIIIQPGQPDIQYRQVPAPGAYRIPVPGLPGVYNSYVPDRGYYQPYGR